MLKSMRIYLILYFFFRLIDDTILTNASIYELEAGQTRTYFDELVQPQKHYKYVAAASFCQLLCMQFFCEFKIKIF